ncbi:MAG: MiaB/RimO family radical SAM methylthiotransferase [Planctomycetota bacterium]
MSPSFHITTFGCKVNQYDGQAVREALAAAGCDEAPLAGRPEFAIVNTCTLTAAADGKARRLIRRIARELPECKIIVTGCMVSRDAAQFEKLPGVWRVFSNDEKPEIADIVASEALGESVRLCAQTNTLPATDTSPATGGVSGFAGRTRAFVKVQDGCDACCTYCIVPSVRGKPRSRPMGEVLEEVRRLAGRFRDGRPNVRVTSQGGPECPPSPRSSIPGSGGGGHSVRRKRRGPPNSATPSDHTDIRAVTFREIVLTGIHVGLYRDESGADLAALIRKVLDVSPVERVRLSSIGPEEITPDLVDLMARSPRFCPHFHIPLQSGSDRVLKRMGRRYTKDEFLAAIDFIRREVDRPSITSDVIVGFPGETGDDFQRTADACRAAGFSRMHIFPFSERPGTAAAKMSGKCPASIIAERKAALGAIASELALAFKRPFVGQTVDVLVETTRDRSGKLCGYTARYLRVLFDGDDSLKGEIVPVRITDAEPAFLCGDLPEGA